MTHTLIQTRLLALGFVCCALAFVPAVHAQDVRVNAKADSAHCRIGEWFKTTVTAEGPASYRITMPAAAGDFGKAEMVGAEEEKRETQGTNQRISRTYTLTVFDTGSVQFSARVVFVKPGDTTHYEALSAPMTMSVATVQVDTTKPFRDIRDVMHVNLTIWDYLLYIGIALALIAIGWYAWRWYKRRGEGAAEVVEAEPDIPPYDRAISALRSIERQSLWERGEHKRYQSDVTGALREYIERAFEVPALEQTTHEIIGGVALKGFPTGVVAELEVLLQRADMTKFAKYIPTPEEHRASLVTAFATLEHMHPLERPREEAPVHAAPAQAVASHAASPPAGTARPSSPDGGGHV